MINAVVCVLKSGGIYDASWVDRLQGGLIQWWPHKAPPFKMFCLTDMEFDIPGVTRLPLKHAWPGWWSKIELFGPTLPQRGRGVYLYLDLDAVIVGPLDRLVAMQHRSFMAMRDPVTAQVASSVMAFSSGWVQSEGRAIYAEMTANPGLCVDTYRDGDQQLISKHVLKFGPGGNKLQGTWLDDVHPGLSVFYKHDQIERRGVPPGCAIVNFHGQPKPCDLPASDPVRTMWECNA